jgi:hypothetical protein
MEFVHDTEGKLLQSTYSFTRLVYWDLRLSRAWSSSAIGFPPSSQCCEYSLGFAFVCDNESWFLSSIFVVGETRDNVFDSGNSYASSDGSC